MSSACVPPYATLTWLPSSSTTIPRVSALSRSSSTTRTLTLFLSIAMAIPRIRISWHPVPARRMSDALQRPGLECRRYRGPASTLLNEIRSNRDVAQQEHNNKDEQDQTKQSAATGESVVSAAVSVAAAE